MCGARVERLGALVSSPPGASAPESCQQLGWDVGHFEPMRRFLRKRQEPDHTGWLLDATSAGKFMP